MSAIFRSDTMLICLIISPFGQRYKLTARVAGTKVSKGTQADKVAKFVNKRGFRELNYDLPLSSPLPKIFFGLTQTQTGNVLLLRNNRIRV